MDEKIYITVDGRLFFLLVFVIFIIGAFAVTTLNIWLENIDHRQKRGITDPLKCNRNFIDYLALKIIGHSSIQKFIVLLSLPLVALYMWIRYPAECIKRTVEHFTRQIKSAKNYLFKIKK